MKPKVSTPNIPKSVVLLIFAVILFEVHVSAQNRLPRFADYPVNEAYIGKNAPLILTREDRMFRTRLREAAGKTEFCWPLHSHRLGLRHKLSYGSGD